MTRIALIALAACLSLAACGPSENETTSAGVTVSEGRALDEAAEMIEQRRLPPEALAKDQPEPEEAAPATEGQ